MSRALITGITGQDGSYLAELLLSKGYEVHGLIRRSSSFNTARIDHIYTDPHEANSWLKLVYGDLNDASSLNKIMRNVQPDEVYNLGAQSQVRVSFDIPEYTAEITGLGTLRMLEAMREINLRPKFYFPHAGPALSSAGCFKTWRSSALQLPTIFSIRSGGGLSPGTRSTWSWSIKSSWQTS